MARPLSSSPAAWVLVQYLYQHPQHIISASIIAVFSVFSFITFLCIFKKTKKSQRKKEVIASNKSQSQSQSRDTKLVSKLNSKIGSKAVAMAKMISWRKAENAGVESVPSDDHHGDISDEAVWRKGIMMGERCSPLNFSGKIVYDSEGNQLLESNSPHHDHQDRSLAS